jgi:hypothetical protein
VLFLFPRVNIIQKKKYMKIALKFVNRRLILEGVNRPSEEGIFSKKNLEDNSS